MLWPRIAPLAPLIFAPLLLRVTFLLFLKVEPLSSWEKRL
jgi:hypothetical protein